MATIALREITTEEQDELRAMVAAYWAELVPDAPVAHDPRRAAAYFAEHFRFGDDTVSLWWVLVDAAKVGFVRVDRWSTEDERGGFIRDFFIGPDVRRRGVGTAVVQAIRGVAERDGWAANRSQCPCGQPERPRLLASAGVRSAALPTSPIRRSRCVMISTANYERHRA